MKQRTKTSDDFFRTISGAQFQRKIPKKLAVAVSGGGDSMALLDLMHWHGQKLGIPVTAVTVDHGLRAEASDEIAHVAKFCHSRAIEHHVLRWVWDRKGNLQAQAREARYGLIAKWAKATDVDLIVLGHTKDDEAENFLMRLARQAGLEGLSAMEQRFSRNGAEWCRPLVQFSRSELRGYLQRQGITWCEDASNSDEKFDRVKARGALAVLSDLGIDAQKIASVTQNLSKANLALKHYSIEIAKKAISLDRGDLLVPCKEENPPYAIPDEILFRLQRAALQFVGGGVYPPRAEAVTELADVIGQGQKGTLNGCLVSPTNGNFWRVSREFNAAKGMACATTEVWDSRWQLNGPHAVFLEIRALGEAVSTCDQWRDTGLPRSSLMSSPAIWRGNDLVAAPLAGMTQGWSAKLAPNRDDFAAFLIRR